MTQSKSRLGGDEGDLAGQSYRVSYSKLINETNSNITIAAYRYSSSGYMDLQTATQTRDAIKHGDDPNTVWRSKNQFSVSLNQGLPASLGMCMSARRCRTTGTTAPVTTRSTRLAIPTATSG
jgi:outer membrane usher protein